MSTLFASILNLSGMLVNYLQQTTSTDDIFRCIFYLGALRVNRGKVILPAPASIADCPFFLCNQTKSYSSYRNLSCKHYQDIWTGQQCIRYNAAHYNTDSYIIGCGSQNFSSMEFCKGIIGL